MRVVRIRPCRPLPRALPAVLLALALAACSRPPEVARAAEPGFRPAAAAPHLPARVAPGVVVRRAQFGILRVEADGEERFVPTDEVPAVDGQTFGWVLEVETSRETLHWQEHLRLPKPPADWGDAADDPDVLISKDGKSVAAQGEDAVDQGSLERFYWSLAAGDPAGEYELDVAVEGRPVAHFRFRVPAPVQEKAILVRNESPSPWT
jgi:hypothetical protein